jgi:hypothetical protein
VHVTGAHLPAIFRPFLGDERAAHGLLAPEADTAQHAQDGQLPDVGDQAAHEREDRVEQNRRHQRLHASVAIRDRPPDHRQAPPEQEQGEQDAAVVPDVAGCRLDTRRRQELGERGHQDERIDEGVHAVEAPAAPRGPETFDLIRIERGLRLHCSGAAYHEASLRA